MDKDIARIVYKTTKLILILVLLVCLMITITTSFNTLPIAIITYILGGFLVYLEQEDKDVLDASIWFFTPFK